MKRMILVAGLLAGAAFCLAAGQGFSHLLGAADWQQQQPIQQQQEVLPTGSEQHPLLGQQPTLTRPPIAADLQNQVHALSAQIAAANRQLQYFQQQLAMVAGPAQQQRQPQPIVDQALVQQLASQQQHQAKDQAASLVANPGEFSDLQATQLTSQQQLQIQAQQQQQLQQQQQQQQQLQLQQQQQHQQQLQLQQQQQQQQLHHQQLQQHQSLPQPPPGHFSPTSTTVGPPSIEPSLSAQGLEGPAQIEQQMEQRPAQLQPPVTQPMGLPHNPTKNDDKFSIGLGVLSPGYTQKFGNTALDFNQDKDGFSFTLSNNGHNNQPPPQPKQQPKGS